MLPTSLTAQVFLLPPGFSIPSTVTVVVPNTRARTEGNFDCDYPFNVLATHPSNVSNRFQQIYPASEFSALSEPMLITQIAFRPDSFKGKPFEAILPNVQIILSTTRASAMYPPFLFGLGCRSSSPDFISCYFENNLGTDKQMVFSGPLYLFSSNTTIEPPAEPPMPTSKDFDIFINLQQPFLYEPAKGNLLLDVKNFTNVPTTFFDAERGGPVFRIDADSVYSPISDGFDEEYPVGVVTRFQFESRPTQVIITEYPLPVRPGSGPLGITAGPARSFGVPQRPAVWFTEAVGNKIGRINTTGVIEKEFGNYLLMGSVPFGITTGPDGNLWFTEAEGGQIGRLTVTADDFPLIYEFPLVSRYGQPVEIAAGPDGNLWFTENRGNKIGKISTGSGFRVRVITEFPLRQAGSAPLGITAGPDGNLWFTDIQANKIGQITTAGVITEFSIPTADSQPTRITTGPDGNLWFTEFGAEQIGKVTIEDE
jgi:sugar lactone lactonase YvrE